MQQNYPPPKSSSPVPYPPASAPGAPGVSSAPFPAEANPPVQREPAGQRPIWAVVAGIYGLVIVLAAVWVGTQAHGWARTRIVNSEPLPEVTELVQQEIQAATNEETVLNGDLDAVADAPAPDPITVLVMGMDSRAGGGTWSANTDSMLIVSLDPQHGNIGMISLARDLYVPIAGSTGHAKINQAYALYGTESAMGTVGNLLGHEIDHFVRLDFQGFVEIIDIIDGIDVNVERTIYDPVYPLPNDLGHDPFYLEAGLQTLDGATALKYVRTRFDTDYGRAERQQKVVRAVFEKVMRVGMIDDLVVRAPRLLRTLSNNFETDIPLPTMVELARHLDSATLNNVQDMVIDKDYGREHTEYDDEGNLTVWQIDPDTEFIRREVDKHFDRLSVDPNSGALAQATPDWVRVEILNGTETGGLAARTSELLTRQGWQVVSISDADRSDYDHTLIINYGVPQSFVERLGQDLALGYKPNISNLNGLDGTRPVDVRIVVGQDAVESVQ